MTIYDKVTFRVSREATEQIEALLMVAGVLDCKYEILRDFDVVEVLIPHRDPRKDRLIDVLEQRGFRVSWRIFQQFTAEDFAQSLLFQISALGSFVDAGYPPDNAEWDLSDMCSSCGARARQVSGMRIRPSAIRSKSDVQWTDPDECHVSERLKWTLEERFGSRGDFVQDLDVRTGKGMPWWQLFPAFELPKISPASSGIDTNAICPRCGQGNYVSLGLNTPFVLVYEMPRAAIEQLPPFARTWEYWGDTNLTPQPNRTVYYSRQSLLVNRECRQLLLERRIRNIVYRPVVVRVLDA